jgi:ubiquinone/menaquinone biosynthesis C-methylase UbiE
MGVYRDQLLPRFTDVVLGKPMEDTRARVAGALSGDVLELGFGSGRNLPHAPASVRRFLAVEPAPVCRKLAARRVEQAPFPVEWIGLDGQDLPLENDSVDHVLVTWTLCTIPDV